MKRSSRHSRKATCSWFLSLPSFCVLGSSSLARVFWVDGRLVGISIKIPSYLGVLSFLYSVSL